MPAKPGPLRPHEQRYPRAHPLPDLPGKPAFGDSFLIVAEGQVTEKLYFELLRKKLGLTTATVKVVHPDYTDAIGLVKSAIDIREQRRQCQAGHKLGNREVGGFDHV